MRQFPPPPRSETKEGEFISGRLEEGDVTRLEHAHAPESSAMPLLGRLPEVSDLTPEWIIQRLMIEATDRGTRTRQSSRVKALETLAKIQGIIDEGMPSGENPIDRAKDLPPAERRKMIAEKVKALINAGVISKGEIDV